MIHPDTLDKGHEVAGPWPSVTVMACVGHRNAASSAAASSAASASAVDLRRVPHPLVSELSVDVGGAPQGVLVMADKWGQCAHTAEPIQVPADIGI
jgi:hypothetical protein